MPNSSSQSFSKSRNFGRRFLAVLLLGLSSFVFLAAGWLNVASSLAGSPSATANTFFAVVTSTNIRHAVASKLVDQLQKDSKSSLGAAFSQHRSQLVQVVEEVIVNPTTQQIARTDFLAAYNALVSNRSVTIDLRPLIYRFTTVMHRVDPQIQATPTQLKHAVVHIKQRGAALRFADSILPAELLLIAISLIGVMMTTGFLVRRARKQYWALGLTLGIPTILILIGGFGISHAVGSVNFNNPNSKIIATEFANRLAKAAYVTSLGAALLTVLCLGVWFVGRAWRTRRRLRSIPAEAASFA
ncbi:MAG TPA: hypothetical protein VGZ04_07065 [Acidimicrobiales bacterium]|nr:hypothetical protein [Acidimicrobiales bacterium]